jgi:hypothetical protein
MRNPGDFRSNRITELNKDLGQQNPELFKVTLIDLLKDKTKSGSMVWDKIVERGESSLDKIQFSTDSWVSHSHRVTGVIEMGIGEIPETQNESLVFEHQRFPDQSSKMIYRFNHEISHLTQPKIFGAFRYESQGGYGPAVNFLSQVANLRQDQSNLGFSALGSLEFYKEQGPVNQADEDTAELINMALIDPEYLHRYLQFLTDPKMGDIRKQKKLVTLSVTAAENLEKIIHESIAYFYND